jgi:tetratricopeptide (TPR) repeat protein
MAWITDPVESYDIVHHAKEKFGPQILDQTRYITSTRQFGGIASGFDGAGVCLTVHENVATNKNKDYEVPKDYNENPGAINSLNDEMRGFANQQGLDLKRAGKIADKGMAFFMEQNFLSSFKCYEIHTLLASDSAIGWLGCGRALYHINVNQLGGGSFAISKGVPPHDNAIKALKFLERAIEIDPSDFTAWYYKGVSLALVGQATSDRDKVKNSIQFLDKALKLEPGHEAALRMKNTYEDWLLMNT